MWLIFKKLIKNHTNIVDWWSNVFFVTKDFAEIDDDI